MEPNSTASPSATLTTSAGDDASILSMLTPLPGGARRLVACPLGLLVAVRTTGSWGPAGGAR
jgi:hypothetical protein